MPIDVRCFASMSPCFRYGTNATLQLELPLGVLIANCAGPNEPECDVATATKAAWEAPLDFPPLRQATVPGDRVVLALGPSVAQAADVVAAIVAGLCDAGVASADITVLRTLADVEAGQADPRSRLSRSHVDVQLATHNPDEQDSLSYLAADDRGEPIYINRWLCDADLVIPIGCLRADQSPPANGERPGGKSGLWNDTLYPTFADSKTLRRFAKGGVALSNGQAAHRHKQIDHLAWLLGIQATVQVVPGGGESALRIIAGSPEAVFHQGREICQSVWQPEIPRRAKLVIAGVGGGQSQQTWENLDRALEAALDLVEDGGAVVLCTQLTAAPGSALTHLAESDHAESTRKRLLKDRSADAPLARLLAESLDRVAIYFLSGLSEEVVTSLGLAYVAQEDEISRLASHYDSCILIAEAQYARPKVAADRVTQLNS